MIVEIQNVSKEIKGKPILTDVNMTLKGGNIYGLFGRNGSGKTMLFRTIAGLIKATKGQVVVDGEVLHKDISFPRSVGVIIESPGFWNHYTGFENLKTLAGIKDEISDDDIRQTIDRVGLNPDDARTFSKYSLGMKQRLAIAQAIMEKPDLLILDEPTNALDEEGIGQVRDILMEEKERGACIIIASHNKEDIDILADERYQIADGKLKRIDE